MSMSLKNRLAASFLSLICFISLSGGPMTAEAGFEPAVKSLDGKSVTLSRLLNGMKGKVVILNFWATWCPMCSSEVSALQALYKDYAPQGLEVVGISLDDGGAKLVKSYIAKKKVSYTVVIGSDEVADAFGGIPGIPVSFLVNRQGKIVKKMMGRQGRQRFEKVIKPLLQP